MSGHADDHPFLIRPHRTLLGLSAPVMLSLIAEPLTSLVDTGFVARLGAAPLAALGVATTLVSSVLWVFNFLSIGTQTEMARAMGAGRAVSGRQISSLALLLGAGLGAALCILGWPAAEAACRLMGLDAGAVPSASAYLRIRLLGSPALLATLAAFGTLRGLQNMRVPLAIAALVNGVNLVLDPLLIFGLGPFPRLELAGAALATTVSQWVGASFAVLAVARRSGLTRRLPWSELPHLLKVGRDLLFRTGSLLLFLALATRAANRIGTQAGAAHQVVRQFWLFSAFLLDAYAVASQSLVGYFAASSRPRLALRVARVTCAWSVGTGAALGLVMILGAASMEVLLVPVSARACFGAAWLVAALWQPVNALSFATDGIHWGTGDYRFLRNAMFAATGTGSVALVVLDGTALLNLTAVWLVTAAWTAIRAGFGMARIWPGIGAAPLRAEGGQ